MIMAQLSGCAFNDTGKMNVYPQSGRLTLNSKPTWPTVTRAPLLDAMVAPENSLLTPSEGEGGGQGSDKTSACDNSCVFTFSEDSVKSINGVFVAKQQTDILPFSFNKTFGKRRILIYQKHSLSPQFWGQFHVILHSRDKKVP